MTKQEIIEMFLSRHKVTHKVQDRIELFQTLIDLAEKNSFPDLTACFKGYLAWVKKDYESALSHFQEAIRLDETSAFPWHGLGNVYQDLRDYEKAKECYEKAIQLDGEWAFSWNNLGTVYARLGDFAKAKELFEKAIKLDDSFLYSLNGLGNVHLMSYDYEKAKEYYEKAIYLDDSFAYPLIGLGNVYTDLKDYEKAKGFFEKAIQLDPDEPHGEFTFGLMFFKQGKYLEAKLHLQRALEGFSGRKDEYFIARIKNLLDEIRELIDSERRAAQDLEPSSPIEMILKVTIRRKLAEESAQNQQSFHQFLIEPSDHGKYAQEDYLLILRRWNSYTPIVADNFQISKGGGYFLKVNQKGIVIDPGFNFIDNFRAAGRLFHEIDAILVSHAHNDHTADLESILTLLDRYNQEIKDSSDPAKENTIRREIARNEGVNEDKISEEEIDKVFLSSKRRKIIDFYLTASVFKKYGGWFDLFSKNDYRLHIIEPGDKKDLIGGVKVHFISAKHEDIISDQNSVGFYIQYQDDFVLIYTGDTGWNNFIEQQYKQIGQQLSQKYRLLLAHLGGVKKQEEFYLTETNKEEYFYPNHLGRLGLVRINEVLQPHVCIISEFGEELRKWRQPLADIYQEAFNHKIVFIPGDIDLKFNLKNRKVMAIKKVKNQKGKECLEYKYINPKLVSSVLLYKDFSLHYYDRSANLDETELVQILGDQFEKCQR